LLLDQVSKKIFVSPAFSRFSVLAGLLCLCLLSFSPRKLRRSSRMLFLALTQQTQTQLFVHTKYSGRTLLTTTKFLSPHFRSKVSNNTHSVDTGRNGSAITHKHTKHNPIENPCIVSHEPFLKTKHTSNV